MKGTTTGIYLYKEVKKVLQCLDIPIQKLASCTKHGQEEQWHAFTYHWHEYNESQSDNMPLPDTSRKSMSEISQNECCYSCFKNSSGQNKWIIILDDTESKYHNAIIQKFVGWVVARCLNVCMTLSQKLNYFWKWRGNVPWLCDHNWMCDFAFCIDITQHMNEMNTNLQGVNHLINETFDTKRAFERSFDCENCNCYHTATHQLWERKNPLTLRNKGKKFSILFNKNSTPIFKIYTSMRAQSTYFQCHFKLMFKLFQLNFKWRLQSCSVIWTWEIHFDMFSSLTFINSLHLLISFWCLVIECEWQTSLEVRMFLNSSFEEWMWSRINP